MAFRFMSVYVVLLGLVVVTAAARNSSRLCPAVANCIARLDRGDECSVLPVPSRSRLVTIPAGDATELRKLRKGVWLHRDLVYNSLIVRHARHIVLIDMPDSESFNKPDGSRTRVTDALEQIMNGVKPTRVDLVYTHQHFDHIGASTRVYQWVGGNYPGAAINIYGSDQVKDAVDMSVSKRAVSPTRIIRGKTSIVLRNGFRIDLSLIPGHTSKDTVVQIPREGSEKAILMHVDVVYPRWAPFSYLSIAGNIPSFFAVHDELMKFDMDVFLDGHMSVGTREDIAENLRFSKDLIAAAKEATASVTDSDTAAAGIADFVTPGKAAYGNLWFAAVTAGRDVVARKCARIMIEKWGCRFGGVAVTAFSHCFSTAVYLSISD